MCIRHGVQTCLILYINSHSACVRLSYTTFCTGNLQGRFCNPSMCLFVHSSVCLSVRLSIHLSVRTYFFWICFFGFFSPYLKLTKMKKQKKKEKKRDRQNRFVCMYVCIFREKEIRLRMTYAQ